MKGIQKVIRQMRNPSLTLGEYFPASFQILTNYLLAQFIRSPELESFCQQYDAYSLAEIHASFSNVDRISAIIQKQRLMTYPAGQHFNGVIYLYNTDPFIKVITLRLPGKYLLIRYRITSKKSFMMLDKL